MNKIISSWSNSDSGMSSVSIQNKYGIFHGMSFCAPEDLDSFSPYAGERYAENRAAASYAKFRYKQEIIKLKTIQNLLKDIENDSKCSAEENKYTIRRLKLKLRDYSQSASDWKNLAYYLNKSIKTQDEERQKILLRTKKKK